MINKNLDEKTLLRFERLAESIDKHCEDNDLQIDLQNLRTIAEHISNNMLSDRQIFEIAKSFMKPKSKKK